MTQLHNARTRSKLSRLQRGAATVEYAVLIGVLFLCGFAAWRYFFKSVSNSVQNSTEIMQNAVGADGQHVGSRHAAEGQVQQ